MSQHTTKNFNIDRAPRRIQLFGDKAKKIESTSRVAGFSCN